MKIFSGNSNPKLAEKIAALAKERLCIPEKFVFPDGEERIRILENVAGDDTVLVQTLSFPVSSNLLELCFITDAIKRSGGKSVTAVIPYLGYQRQDHEFREGEAVSLAVVIKIIEAAGVDKVILFDLHSIKIPELFKIRAVHLSALPLFAETIKGIGIKEAILVTPDMGGIRRIKILSGLLKGLPFASIVKNRDLATGGIQITDINLPENFDLEGKTAYVVDDMISTGGTIVKASEILKRRGVKKIFVFATHPVFSQNASIVLQNTDIEKVYVTDSISVSKKNRFPKLEILTLAPLITREL